MSKQYLVGALRTAVSQGVDFTKGLPQGSRDPVRDVEQLIDKDVADVIRPFWAALQERYPDWGQPLKRTISIQGTAPR